MVLPRSIGASRQHSSDRWRQRRWDEGDCEPVALPGVSLRLEDDVPRDATNFKALTKGQLLIITASKRTKEMACLQSGYERA